MYNGKPNITGPKIWPSFFLIWQSFAPFLYMLESFCLYYYYTTYYRIQMELELENYLY